MTHPLIARLSSTPEWATQAHRVPEDNAVEYSRMVGIAACADDSQCEEIYLIQRDDQETPTGEPMILFAGSRWTLAEVKGMIQLLEKGVGLICQAKIANIDRANVSVQQSVAS